MLNKQINFSDYDDKENVKNENGVNQTEIFNQICSQDTPFTEQLVRLIISKNNCFRRSKQIIDLWQPMFLAKLRIKSIN